MADASKLKGLRRSGLGAPPPVDEARTDLAPEREHRLLHGQGSSELTHMPAGHPARLDGRTMRRSGRTIQFATRVSPEFDDRVRQIALRDGMLLVEVLEHALNAYEASIKKAGR